MSTQSSGGVPADPGEPSPAGPLSAELSSPVGSFPPEEAFSVGAPQPEQGPQAAQYPQVSTPMPDPTWEGEPQTEPGAALTSEEFFGQDRPQLAPPMIMGPVPDVHVTSGFNFAWLKLRQNLGTLVLVALSYAGIGVLITLVFGGMMAASRSAAAAAFAAIVLVVVVILFGGVTQANITTGTLKLVAGHPVEYKDFFTFKNVLPVIWASLMVAVASGLLAFTIAAPVVIGFLTVFTTLFIVDRGYGPWNAIAESARLVWDNIGTVAVFILGSAIAAYVGLVFFGLGILFAFPVIMIAEVWLYRQLTGGAESLTPPH